MGFILLQTFFFLNGGTKHERMYLLTIVSHNKTNVCTNIASEDFYGNLKTNLTGISFKVDYGDLFILN